MKIKVTTSSLTTAAMIFVSTLAFLIILGAFLLDRYVFIVLVIVCLLMLYIGVYVFIYCINKLIRSYSNELAKTMESMLEGENSIEFTSEKESYLSSVQSHLYRLYETLQTHKRYELDEKEKLQELISDIAHQVKTPVSNLKTINYLLLDEIENQKYKDFLNNSIIQVDKLDFFMQALIKTSRLEMGIISLNVQSFPLYITLSNALNGVVMQACKKNIKIEVYCDKHLRVVHDQKWTEEAMFNILDNAVKYISNEKRIVITAERWESFVNITIQDSGIGIKECELSKIFKRFYRSSEVSNIKGVGIGLYLVRKIISMQNGMIEVESEYGKGTKFSIYLPCS